MSAHRSPTPYNPRTSLRILSSVLILLIFASLTMILSNLARDLAPRAVPSTSQTPSPSPEPTQGTLAMPVIGPETFPNDDVLGPDPFDSDDEGVPADVTPPADTCK